MSTSFEQYLIERGYVADPDKGPITSKEYSSMGTLCRTYRKQDTVFVFGLGELGYPPHLLYPELFFTDFIPEPATWFRPCSTAEVLQYQGTHFKEIVEAHEVLRSNGNCVELLQTSEGTQVGNKSLKEYFESWKRQREKQ